MPRYARKQSQTQYYHVVVKGNNSQNIFEEDEDYKRFMAILRRYRAKCGFDIYACCLMTNHIHIVVNTPQYNVSQAFHNINTLYAQWFNKKYSRTGPLYDDRFYSEPIETISHFYAAIRYVHLNPFKAGLEEKIGTTYPWNSIYNYLSHKKSIISCQTVLKQMGGVKNFIDFHNLPNEDLFLDVNISPSKLKELKIIRSLKEKFGMESLLNVASLSEIKRNECIREMSRMKLSPAKISRLTGISRYSVTKILQKAE